MISCAAVWNPPLPAERRYAEKQDYDLMKAKAEVIIKAAVEAECSVFVLSAFGCGAFGNPPDQVA
eukprot:1802520-Alexandrium_andersonii.AAC.1